MTLLRQFVPKVPWQRPTEEFQEDKFAKTSRGPRESRWKLWCSLAERSLPPLPITVELIDKVGLCLSKLAIGPRPNTTVLL